MSKFSIEDLKLDYVVFDGEVCTITDAAKKKFGFASGQNISSFIFYKMLKFNRAECQAKLEIQKAMEKWK